MIWGVIWAGGAAGVYSFYRMSGIDENESRSSGVVFASLWPVLVPLGIFWMALDALRR